MKGYYYQTRKGKRVKVKKGKNRINIYSGTKVKRAVVRGAIPTRDGQIYGKGVISIGDRSPSIKSTSGVALSKKGETIKVTGRAGSVKGGALVGRKRGRKIDAIAYSYSPDLVEFSQGYYYQTRNGKRVRVKKGRMKLNMQIRDDLVAGAKYGGSALGFVAGAGVGNQLVKTAGRNGWLRNTAMAGGAVTGMAIAAILANHLLDRFDILSR